MTKRNPEVYRRYDQARPQYPYRLPRELTNEVESLRQEFGFSKQQLMERIFELGYPMLLDELLLNG